MSDIITAVKFHYRANKTSKYFVQREVSRYVACILVCETTSIVPFLFANSIF